jgi:glutamine amidotransferase
VAGVKKVVVLDYGSGNLRSAERALTRVGADVTVTADQRAALDADGLVVPRRRLRALHARAARRRRPAARSAAGWRRRPVLGICVGMQVLFERGVEHGHDAEGCGEWPGTVEELEARVLPHMGWNTVAAPRTRSVRRLPTSGFYFVHSYGVREFTLGQDGARAAGPAEGHLGRARRPLRRRVENAALSATQFHPEKSGDAGASC